MTARLKVGSKRTFSGLRLTVEQRLPHGLYLMRDTNGMARLHNGARKAGYRGYVGHWYRRSGEECYRVRVWGNDNSIRHARNCPTQQAAERALVRLAQKIGGK